MMRGRSSEKAGQRGRRQIDTAGRLEWLGKRFARFRVEHPRGTRYPEELRQAALALLGEVEPDALYRRCGVSFRQVMDWKAARRAHLGKTLESEPAKVRVFSVVDAEPAVATALAPAARTAEPEIELQLGPWSVTVRLANRSPAERGHACCR